MKKHKIVKQPAVPKRLLLPVSMLAVVMMLSYVQSFAQTNYATLKGKVVELGNESVPVEFATVQILPQGSVSTTNTTTTITGYL